MAETNRVAIESDARSARREAEYDAKQAEREDWGHRQVLAWERIAGALERLASVDSGGAK